MVKWLMRRGIAAFERQWNYDASYVHEIIEASPRAASCASLSNQRQIVFFGFMLVCSFLLVQVVANSVPNTQPALPQRRTIPASTERKFGASSWR